MTDATATATPGGPVACYQQFLREGRFMLQFNPATGKYVFFPRVAMPGTGDTNLEWRPASGEGVVYASTVNRLRTGDYNVVLVELDEGPRLMSRVDNRIEVPIGARVRARIVTADAEPFVVFDALEETSP